MLNIESICWSLWPGHMSTSWPLPPPRWAQPPPPGHLLLLGGRNLWLSTSVPFSLWWRDNKTTGGGRHAVKRENPRNAVPRAGYLKMQKWLRLLELPQYILHFAVAMPDVETAGDSLRRLSHNLRQHIRLHHAVVDVGSQLCDPCRSMGPRPPRLRPSCHGHEVRGLNCSNRGGVC
jgi:hypothetical protein